MYENGFFNEFSIDQMVRTNLYSSAQLELISNFEKRLEKNSKALTKLITQSTNSKKWLPTSKTGTRIKKIDEYRLLSSKP